MVYTVQTGLLTSVASLGCVIAYAISPNTYIFLAIYFPLSKLYINALLATLNARDTVRGRHSGRSGATGNAFSISMEGMRFNQSVNQTATSDSRFGDGFDDATRIPPRPGSRYNGAAKQGGGGVFVQVDTTTDGSAYNAKAPEPVRNGDPDHLTAYGAV